jgi:hypothetical protein
MPDDRDTARRALDMQGRARDVRMMELPCYMVWSKRKMAEGESEALIAHLDATSMWLLPEDAAKITEHDFEDLLDDLKAEFGDSPAV